MNALKIIQLYKTEFAILRQSRYIRNAIIVQIPLFSPTGEILIQNETKIILFGILKFLYSKIVIMKIK